VPACTGLAYVRGAADLDLPPGPAFVPELAAPSFASIVLVAVSLYVRIGVLETPAFTRLRDEHSIEQTFRLRTPMNGDAPRGRFATGNARRDRKPWQPALADASGCRPGSLHALGGSRPLVGRLHLSGMIACMGDAMSSGRRCSSWGTWRQAPLGQRSDGGAAQAGGDASAINADSMDGQASPQ
jgi:hypothetical protein